MTKEGLPQYAQGNLLFFPRGDVTGRFALRTGDREG